MISLIKVNNSLAQNVGISSSQERQEIVVKNAKDQSICVKGNFDYQDIKIVSVDYSQHIKISNSGNCPSAPTEYRIYKGEYEATPKRTSQIMPTAQTIMQKDFTVKAIPYSKTPNHKGANTISIG